ncbi:ABC transporter ATP-binding protein [Paucibacter sp. Y2R2-4]|uniref:ABC transporter ATP-binding protein n=1 Tax=Paucibacter sp. Y2R2-4 TaxID=2893553 RepID=UPI0021E4A85E|nr:ATP-binding cassette domain-containing protein [Paucibacter sp. Y2R2-4]MCV2348468.1 ATP-binding cassette domain-containing protein [Paucibacter sp. Y2R2-4]
MSALIEWRGLRYRYPQGTLLSFDDFQLPAGKHLLLRGKSGSGKSSLLALLAGLLSPTEGQIVIAGSALHHLNARQRDAWRGAQLGFVPQRLHLSPALTVLENLSLPALSAGLVPDLVRARELLNRLDLGEELAQRRPHQLSLGQAQRVALARALMRRPQLLLADEPSANLDDESLQRMLELLLLSAKESGACLVLATHDPRLAERLQQGSAAGHWQELCLKPHAASVGAWA